MIRFCIALQSVRVLGVLAVGFGSIAHADAFWPMNGKPVGKAAGAQDQIALASHNGQAVLAWRDGRWNPTDASDIYGQLVSVTGSFLWTPGDSGKAICRASNAQAEPTVALGSTGQSWIAWQDSRPCAQTSGQVYIQGATSFGTHSCTTNGERIITEPHCQSGDRHTSVHPAILPLTEGALVAWNYRPPAGFSYGDYVNVQQIGVACGLGWGAEGTRLYSINWSDTPELRPLILSDTAGGAIVVWGDPFQPLNVGGGRVLLRRVDASGAALWGGELLASTANARQNTPDAVPDGTGGVIVAWEHGALGSRSIHVQRVDALGVRQWTDGGKVVVDGPGDHRAPQLVRSTGGRTFVVWQRGAAGAEDLLAQRINFLGDTLGVRVTVTQAAFAQVNHRAIEGENGACIVAWEDKRNLALGDDGDIYATQIDADGTMLGTVDGTPVCTVTPSKQGAPELAPNGFGGAFLAWVDQRNVNQDVYLTMLWRDFHRAPATDVGQIAIRRLSVFPNPARRGTTITLALPAPTSASVAILDVAGRLVRVLGPSTTSSVHRFDWDGRDSWGRVAESGVYWVRSNEDTRGRRVVVIR